MLPYQGASALSQHFKYGQGMTQDANSPNEFPLQGDWAPSKSQGEEPGHLEGAWAGIPVPSWLKELVEVVRASKIPPGRLTLEVFQAHLTGRVEPEHTEGLVYPTWCRSTSGSPRSVQVTLYLNEENHAFIHQWT